MAITLERPEYKLNQPKTRRSHLEMIAEILETCTEISTRTAIVYKCNLNFKLIRKYLDLLEKNNLIERIEAGKASYYRTTGRGRKAVEQINCAKQLVFSSEDIFEAPTSVF